jgi:hypothetical protein
MFKKSTMMLMILAIVATLFVSCGSEPAAKVDETPVAKPVIGKEGVPQPAWVNKVPKSAETYYAIGYSMKSSKQLSITFAEQDARDQVARWVGTNVKTALTNYVSESGEGKNIQVLSFAESISKQVADQTVVGVERDDLWVDAEGGVYVMCSFPKANVGKSFEEVSGSFVRNEAAAFAEFKAKEALSFLDKETAKE